MTDTEVVNEPEKTTVKKRIDKLTLNNQVRILLMLVGRSSSTWYLIFLDSVNAERCQASSIMGNQPLEQCMFL